MRITYDDGLTHKSVEYASEFTNWQKIPLTNKQDTQWASEVISTDKVLPGKYMYKYVVDGKWTLRDDVDKTRDQSGIENHVVEIVDDHDDCGETQQDENTPLLGNKPVQGGNSSSNAQSTNNSDNNNSSRQTQQQSENSGFILFIKSLVKRLVWLLSFGYCYRER